MDDLTIDNVLDTMQIIVDTREQPNPRFHKRVSQFKHTWIREKLNYGDYSCKYTMPSGEVFNFSATVCIERKQDLEELCMCMGKQRKRFTAEFERAKADNCKVYLLVEKAT